MRVHILTAYSDDHYLILGVFANYIDAKKAMIEEQEEFGEYGINHMISSYRVIERLK